MPFIVIQPLDMPAPNNIGAYNIEKLTKKAAGYALRPIQPLGLKKF